MHRLFALILTFSICIFDSLGSSPSPRNRQALSPASTNTARLNSGQCPACAQAGQQTIYAPLTRLDESSGTEINLNCRSPHSMQVTPTFYSKKGGAFTGEVFVMQAAEVKTIDLRSLM